MKSKAVLFMFAVGLISTGPLAIRGDAQDKKAAPQVEIPKPGVPQIMTLEGNFVRAAYNNEGYVILGYQLANESLGQEWMLLEVGMTLRDKVPDYTLRRGALSLDTPTAQGVPLATNMDYREVNLSALEAREKVQRDSINYFPPTAVNACRIGFFADLDQRLMAYDQVELNYRQACVGRLFFKVPGGIQHGQHWLNVKFEQTLIRVPFRILTEDEEKMLSKNFKDIKKQVQDAFKKP